MQAATAGLQHIASFMRHPVTGLPAGRAASRSRWIGSEGAVGCRIL